jgi:hypothetical protein
MVKFQIYTLLVFLYYNIIICVQSLFVCSSLSLSLFCAVGRKGSLLTCLQTAITYLSLAQRLGLGLGLGLDLDRRRLPPLPLFIHSRNHGHRSLSSLYNRITKAPETSLITNAVAVLFYLQKFMYHTKKERKQR